MEKIKRYLKKLYNIASMEEMRILPGNIAFFLVLSLMPILTLAGIICNKLLTFVDVKEIIVGFIPSSLESILNSFFTIEVGSHLIIFLIIGFIVASNGAHAIILSSNNLYKIDAGNFIVRRIKAFFLTIILMLMLMFALVVLAFGNIILKFILSLEFFEFINYNIYSLFIWLKYPIAFIVIYFLVKALYTMAPDKKIPSKYVTLGSLFTTIGWLLVTLGYAFYITNIANYNRFYGSLSNIIILIIWIYLISYVFVLGIAINTSYYGLDFEKMNNKK